MRNRWRLWAWSAVVAPLIVLLLYNNESDKIFCTFLYGWLNERKWNSKFFLFISKLYCFYFWVRPVWKAPVVLINNFDITILVFRLLLVHVFPAPFFSSFFNFPVPRSRYKFPRLLLVSQTFANEWMPCSLIFFAFFNSWLRLRMWFVSYVKSTSMNNLVSSSFALLFASGWSCRNLLK